MIKLYLFPSVKNFIFQNVNFYFGYYVYKTALINSAGIDCA